MCLRAFGDERLLSFTIEKDEDEAEEKLRLKRKCEEEKQRGGPAVIVVHVGLTITKI
jgi:hypothetical protein